MATNKIDINPDFIVTPPMNRCENCRFWQQFESDNFGAKTGLCVVHPPVFVGTNEDGVPDFAQPVTGIFATCGEWQEFKKCQLPNGRVSEGPHRWIFPSSADNKVKEEET